MSGIQGYLHTKTSLTILFKNGSAYRYDVSEVFTKNMLAQAVKLAKTGKGLNSYLNKLPQVQKYGYLDSTLGKKSFKPYGV